VLFDPARRYFDLASDIRINEASYQWVLNGWIIQFVNSSGYQERSTTLLTPGKLYAIHDRYGSEVPWYEISPLMKPATNTFRMGRSGNSIERPSVTGVINGDI
jgi:hypothetical protein